MAIIQEFKEDESHVYHRLVDNITGDYSSWAGYTRVTYLHGLVGITAYYAEKEMVVTPEEFVKLIATT